MSLRAIAGLLLVALPLAAADRAPAWLQEFATAEIPSYDRSVPAVVLVKQTTRTVVADGVLRTTVRKAVRILTRKGRREAVASVRYRTDSGKVRSLQAWLIRPRGEVKKYGKKETLDMAAVADDVYNEVRVRVISASSDSEPGAVFGWEAQTEDRSIFTQFEWQFQGELPTLNSRFRLSLPKGWRAESLTFHHDPIEPQVSGSTYTWQLVNLPYRETEEAGPSVSALVPRLAVSYFPPDGARGAGPTFSEWTDVSRWLTGLNDSQTSATPELTAKAQELTAGTATEFEKIEALGRYAQDINYISIQTGVGRGGGYRPHQAAEVFQKSYGDCKDKANLMRMMLKTIGIESYPVAIYAGDRSYVRPDWASPQQFNHAIIAVRVSDETDAPAVTAVDGHGRLLFFDPTDEYTPVGHLPDHEQDSHALLVAGDSGSLVRMPSTEPAANRLERNVKAKLLADGAISVAVREEAWGQSATHNRRLLKELTQPEYRKLIERWISRGAPGAKVSTVEGRDEADGRFTLGVDFLAERYGQSMRGQLIIFKPAVVSRRDALFFSEEAREHPVMLDSRAYAETVSVELPIGFAIDEKPDDIEIEEPFGVFRASWKAEENRVVFERSLELQTAVIPPEEYEQVRTFFNYVNGAANGPVVLVRE